MRIYIRHAQKAYRNGFPHLSRCGRDAPTYAHDPPLTPKGKLDAINLANKLLELYPTPTLIITSPYLRARETASHMASVIINHQASPSITIRCQNDIGEYLGNHAEKPLDVSPSTYRHFPPHPESFHVFQQRVAAHYAQWKGSGDREVTWVITHGIVINEIIKPYYGTRRIPYLGYIVCEQDKMPTLYFT